MSTSALSTQERPLDFLQHLREVLGSDGVCVLQERYMPYMLQQNSYDAIRHQNISYYALKQIKWMAREAGLKIAGVWLNDEDSGTATIAVSGRDSLYEDCPEVENILDEEARKGFHTVHPYKCFAERVIAGQTLLRTFFDKARDAGRSVCALGASESGNVILQCCRTTGADISKVGEINSRKIGAFTPGTLLPIVREDEVLDSKPHFLLVLPWRLRGTFLTKPRLAGCNLLFPLPRLEVVRA